MQTATVLVTYPITFTSVYSTAISHYAQGSGWGHCSDAFMEANPSSMKLCQYQPFDVTKDANTMWYICVGY